MRSELLQFVQGRIEQGIHSGDMDPQSALMFQYKTLADELVLGGVYIKHFLADPAMSLDDPYLLCHDLMLVCFHRARGPRCSPLCGSAQSSRAREMMKPCAVPVDAFAAVVVYVICPQQIAISPANPRCIAVPEGVPPVQPGPPIRHMKHLCQCLRALHMLIIANPSVEDEITGRAKPYLPALIYLVEASEVCGCVWLFVFGSVWLYLCGCEWLFVFVFSCVCCCVLAAACTCIAAAVSSY